MRALVTGAAGFAGSHLVRSLLADGVEVWAGTIDPAPPSRDVRWVTLDVSQPDSVFAAVAASRPDEVYHLAGQSSVGASFGDPLGTWDVNATGTVRLLEAIPDGSSFVFASSAEVYGSVPEEAQPIQEETPLRPTNPYAASKAAAEMACVAAASARGVRAVIARSFNHTGPGQDERFALASFARQLAESEGRAPLRVGNLDARRDLLDVRDVVRAYRHLAQRGEPGGAYNVCAGRAVSIREALEMLISRTGFPVEEVVDAERVRPLDAPLLQGDPTRIRALGWEPSIPLEQTLSDLLESHRRAVRGGLPA